MLIEGVMLYLLIIEVYNTELKLPFCYLFSFGELQKQLDSLTVFTQMKRLIIKMNFPSLIN